MARHEDLTVGKLTLTDSLNVGNVSGSTTCAADVLVIPTSARYVAKTTGTDAEACTLANGKPGQILTVSLVAEGGAAGDATITPATASGFVSVALAEVGNTVTLQYVDDTVGWVVVGTAAVTTAVAIALS